MKASVIIPTKNAGPDFEFVLNAVLTQKTDWPYELLIIDSGSVDETLNLCAAKGVRTHCIAAHEFGHGRTRNLGMALTTGEFGVFLTQDALPADEYWLSNLVSAAEQPNVAGVFGRHRAYSGGNPFIRRDIDAHFDGFCRWPSVVCLDDEARYANDVVYRQFLHFFSSNNACVRRSVWDEIQFPDVEFSEDQQWAKLVIEAGHKKAYADTAVVYHSHNFGTVETLRRSFDESRALCASFGYRLCPTLPHLLAQTVRTTLNDWRHLKKERMLLNDFLWAIKSPALNGMRQTGYYLGQHAGVLPIWALNRLSRDRALHLQGARHDARTT